MVTIRFQAPSSMLLINLLGVFGLLMLAAAVGGLTHNWWWSVLVLAVEAVFLSVVGAMNARPVAESAEAVTVRRVA